MPSGSLRALLRAIPAPHVGCASEDAPALGASACAIAAHGLARGAGAGWKEQAPDDIETTGSLCSGPGDLSSDDEQVLLVGRRHASAEVLAGPDGLVSLNSHEGARRGRELMDMLGWHAEPGLVAQGAQEARSSCSASRLHASAQPFVPLLQTQPPAAPPPPAAPSPSLERRRASLVPRGAGELCPAAVRAAAAQAFGSRVVEVEGNVHVGFLVHLREGSWEGGARAAHEALMPLLWPLMGQEVAGMEIVTVRSRLWLAMHCVHRPPEACWDFSTTGFCWRGGACRWRHTPVERRTVDIEVLF